MNMVMGKIWSNLPEVLRPYNGLYIKYLQNCHIIASFTIGDKLCFASHSGVPYYEDKKEGHTPHFYIPSKIGEENKYLGGNNIDNIKILNKHFNNFIQNPKGIDYKSNEYKKYITMTAGCEKTVEPYSSNASPIVSSVNLSLIQDKSKKSLDILTRDGVAKIYNIFGHQPSGFLPYINRVASDYDDTSEGAISYHIDLDISKAENAGGISNEKSFVYLKITGDDDRLYGKTVSSVKYNAVKKQHNDANNIIHLEKVDDKEGITIDYSNDGIELDKYCENGYQINAIYDGIPIVIFTVDGIKHYGINAKYSLIEYDNKVSGLHNSQSSKPHSVSKISLVGGKNDKIYTKSVKRYMYGKRRMVIYLGKRGGEYVKTSGKYISLAKFIQGINKKI